jgi:hypothetical protein
MNTVSKCCGAKIHKQNGVYFCTHTNCLRIIGKNDIKRNYSPLIIIIAFFLITCGFSIHAGSPKIAINSIIKHISVDTVEDITPNDTNILKELVENKCVLPSVAIAQSKIETSHYTSNVCKENKNLFGIKWHKCKYVKGAENGHATFKTYKDCIKCYCHIQTMYLKAIDGKYAENPNYISLIKQM